MSLVNFIFIMIYIIHNTLVLLKNYLNYLEVGIFKLFFKEYNRLLFLKKKLIFFITCNDGKFKS